VANLIALRCSSAVALLNIRFSWTRTP
jgi:hypothetical protein